MGIASSSTADPLASKLADLIRERILDSDIEPETNLYDVGLDSLAIMQLLLLIEEEFQVSIPVESVSRANFSSVQTIAGLLRERDVCVDEPEVETPPPAKPAPAVEAPAADDDGSLATMGGCDYFTVCFDAWSRKTRQGGHKAHSFLVLDRAPDVESLRAVLAGCPVTHPLLFARLRRRKWIGSFQWVATDSPPAIPVACWREDGSPGRLADAVRCASAQEKAEEIVNTPLPRAKTGGPHVRLNLIEQKSGEVMLILSWSHLVMDGVGAEFFLRDLARLSGDDSIELIPQIARKAPPPINWKEAFDQSMPMIRYFNTLVDKTFDCLGPRRPKAGRTHFEVHTLTDEQTRRVRSRCSELCGELVSMPFFLACAARAHDRVFAERGLKPNAHVCSVPVQTRRKGGRGPIFLNHITMFFGVVGREDLSRIEDSVTSLVAQHTAFLKNQLGEALDRLMRIMSVMPPLLYMRFIMFQMRGPFASFFHSHTGEFAPGLNEFFGANVLNAYHVPGIATPPGDGIFCNEKNGRLVVTMSWHEESLSESERALMLDQFLHDLGAA